MSMKYPYKDLPKPTPEQKAKFAKYLSLQHAMQSGVALQHGLGSSDQQPKHLRVGINTALVELGAIQGLLMAKGIITYDELLDALLERMQAEVDYYERATGAKLA